MEATAHKVSLAMINSGLFLLLFLLFLAAARRYEAFAMVVFFLCCAFILLRFLFQTADTLPISL